MLPDQAEALAIILNKTDEYSKTLKCTSEQKETEKTEKHIVTFRTSDEGDFYVTICENERFTMTSLVYNRKEAKGVAPMMAKSKKLCAFVDEKIKP